ncbi:MAG: hypothetical protein VYD64_07075 [Pseudomonadota bacterium]|nr:hypothetical protein [Pseudomonadota bacterium]
MEILAAPGTVGVLASPGRMLRFGEVRHRRNEPGADDGGRADKELPTGRIRRVRNTVFADECARTSRDRLAQETKWIGYCQFVYSHSVLSRRAVQ